MEQSVNWLENNDKDTEFVGFDKMLKWLKEGCPKTNIDNEYHFCDKLILDRVLKAKVYLTVLLTRKNVNKNVFL